MSSEKYGFPPQTLNPNGNGFSFGNVWQPADSVQRDNLILAEMKKIPSTLEAQYENIPNFFDPKGNRASGREVTATFGKYMAEEILLKDPKIFDMNFPRLRFPKLLGLGYSANDYHEIAKKILDNKIAVYETKENIEKSGFIGVYLNVNQFVFTPDVTKEPQKFVGTIIHETTHAIQDLKKWRESDQDREVDAHFAQAYFMVLKGQEHLLKASRMDEFISLAKLRIDDPNLFKTMYFSSKLPKLRVIIDQEYKPKFADQAKFEKEFPKRHRLDGIGG